MPDLTVTDDDRRRDLAALLIQAEYEGVHLGGNGAALRRALAAEEMLRRQHESSATRYQMLATAFRQRDEAERGRLLATHEATQLRLALDAAERENTLLREELSQTPATLPDPTQAAELEGLRARVARLESTLTLSLMPFGGAPCP